MNVRSRMVSSIMFSLTLAVCMVPAAHAHMMVAQHGTLNVVGDGAFMVLSVPISAFEGIDDDNDGLLSMAEFTRHRLAIVEAVKQQVVLEDLEGIRPLQGMMLSPAAEHENSNRPVSQLIVMGRFALDDPNSPLLFQIGLFGEHSTERLMEITATRKLDRQEHVFELTPEMSAGLLFPGSS